MWRLHRRIYYQAFRQAETPTYHTVQLRRAHETLFRVLQDPSEYPGHFETSVAQFFLVPAEPGFHQV
ncbi:hypothetical protein C8R48DRAFT_666912 [Suillus tomentosus]|nr:hypothetical protein C8R48DRAFT_666912 [Suillus tomentosus]